MLRCICKGLKAGKWSNVMVDTLESDWPMSMGSWCKLRLLLEL